MTETSTEIPAAIQDVDAAIKVLADARKQYRDACKSAFKTYLQHLFDTHEDLNLITFVGWTPGFNDGSPCRHSSQILSSRDDFDDWGLEIPEEFDLETFNNLPTKVLQDIDRNLAKFFDYLELEYNTDFIVRITRGDIDGFILPDNWEMMTASQREAFELDKNSSSLKITKEYYDCGY